MNIRLLIEASLRVLSRYKLRTFFMGLGVALGVATLFVARALGAGAEREMLDKVNRMFGPSSLMIRAGGPGVPDPDNLVIADLEAIEESVEQVMMWDPMVILGGREVKSGDANRQVTIYGHSERAEDVWQRGVIEGRFFTAEDLAGAARVALVGTRTAEALFGESSPIGEQILIGTAPFRVVGVLEPIGIDPHGMDRDEDVHVPVTTAMRRLLNVDDIAMAKLVVHDPATVEDAAATIAEILRERHGILAGEPDDFMIFTPKFVQGMIARANRTLRVFLPAAGGVVLLVAALVIASIMLIAVRERVAEVGLRKALGATEGQIGLQFLLETLGVTLLSGLVGLGLGVGAIVAVSRAMRLTTVIPADAIALGVGAALLVGLLAGVLPARQAARLDPVEALR